MCWARHCACWHCAQSCLQSVPRCPSPPPLQALQNWHKETYSHCWEQRRWRPCGTGRGVEHCALAGHQRGPWLLPLLLLPGRTRRSAAGTGVEEEPFTSCRTHTAARGVSCPCAVCTSIPVGLWGRDRGCCRRSSWDVSGRDQGRAGATMEALRCRCVVVAIVPSSATTARLRCCWDGGDIRGTALRATSPRRVLWMQSCRLGITRKIFRNKI